MGNCEYFSQKIGITLLRAPPLPLIVRNRRPRDMSGMVTILNTALFRHLIIVPVRHPSRKACASNMRPGGSLRDAGSDQMAFLSQSKNTRIYLTQPER